MATVKLSNTIHVRYYFPYLSILCRCSDIRLIYCLSVSMYNKISWFSLDIHQHNHVAFISGSKEYLSTAGQGPCHTHFRVCVLFIVEDRTVTVKCRTVIKALFLYLNLYLSVMLNSLSCLLTSISFLKPIQKIRITSRIME